MVLRAAMIHRRWLTRTLWCLLCLWSVAAWCGSTFAAEPPTRYFVMRDGRKIPLRESTTEYGVIFKDVSSVKTGAARLRSTIGAEVHDFSGKHESRVKRLRVAKTSADLKARIATDPAVAEVHPTYYFPRATKSAIGTGTLLVRVQPRQTDQELQKLWDDFGVTVVKHQPGQEDTYILQPSNMDELRCAEKMADDARTVWAQPNLRSPVEQRQIAPSDEFFSLQWHLDNTGQDGATPDADIDAPEAWTIANGQDVLIGMFDDACDVDHPDLRTGYTGAGQDLALSSNADGADDPRPKQPFDAHGTRVLGLAVARANSIGIRGVAYQSQFTVSRGVLAGLTDAEMAQAFVFARQQDVDVHINSWGQAPGIATPAVIVDQIEGAFRSGRDKGDLDGDGVPDPLGMVILFASGNLDVENEPGFEISTLPSVIAVGASHSGDARASYSNYGDTLNFLAPSGDDFRLALWTTDNRDTTEIANPGVNIGGVNIEIPGFELPETDSSGLYTENFSGTSGSCPIAAGVAALILSVNPTLTATDVRIIMEHTCDKISPASANYDGISNRSLKYGYGRINAKSAVDAAVQSKTTLRTWPDLPADVTIKDSRIEWRRSTGTDEFLVVESNAAFGFIPEDGACYDPDQIGCRDAAIVDLPGGVIVSAVGCETLACSSGISDLCVDPKGGEDHCLDFVSSSKKYFALYARSTDGRYSFGAAIDTDSAGAATPDTGGPTTGAPAVTIRATPIQGESPLSVQFQGNAVSTAAIDESRTAWDFDTSDSTLVDSTNRTAVHTYTADAGQKQSFKATLTMFDVDGNSGSAEVTIQVTGPETEASSASQQSKDVTISIGTVNNPSANITSGTSPLTVLFSIDAASLAGELDSITWDLGDGDMATSLSAPHTYVNTSDRTQRIAITATVSSITNLGVISKASSTRFLTVEPGGVSTDSGNPNLGGAGVSGGSGGAASPCGVIGMVSWLGMGGVLLSVRLVRRKRRAGSIDA